MEPEASIVVLSDFFSLPLLTPELYTKLCFLVIAFCLTYHSCSYSQCSDSCTTTGAGCLYDVPPRSPSRCFHSHSPYSIPPAEQDRSPRRCRRYSTGLQNYHFGSQKSRQRNMCLNTAFKPSHMRGARPRPNDQFV